MLVKVQGQASDAHYVYLGAYPHDDAIAFAKMVKLVINPRNGIAELVAADAESAVEAAVAGALEEGRLPRSWQSGRRSRFPRTSTRRTTPARDAGHHARPAARPRDRASLRRARPHDHGRA
ncbi:hypothetical protein NKG05_10885 [Oerskovia sp. M15]